MPRKKASPRRALQKAAERKSRGLTGFTRPEREVQVREAQSGASRIVRASAKQQRKKKK